MTEDWRSEEWRKETNKTIVNNLVSEIGRAHV